MKTPATELTELLQQIEKTIGAANPELAATTAAKAVDKFGQGYTSNVELYRLMHYWINRVVSTKEPVVKASIEARIEDLLNVVRPPDLESEQ